MTMNKKKKVGRPITLSSDHSRWTILIPWETRVSVTKAAEREQMNLNAWIDKALLNASREVFIEEGPKTEQVFQITKQTDKVNRPWWKRIKK